MSSLRKHLAGARASKKGEFFTLYDDVQFELVHYLDQLKGKVVYCPCDDKDSSFVKYFLELKSKGLIEDLLYTSLQDGIDCLGEKAGVYYQQADIVVTNPPFSIFRSFLEVLNRNNKKFIIWGTNNCVCYKQVSSMLVRDQIRLGYIANKTCEFEVPREYAIESRSKAFLRGDKYYIKVAAISTFTNLDVDRAGCLELNTKYDPALHLKYVNFDAVNCDKTSLIPYDYDGYIGVPITYLAKHDPTMFRIIGIFNNYDVMDEESGCITGDLVLLDKAPWKTRGPCLPPNKPTYVRILIKRIEN